MGGKPKAAVLQSSFGSTENDKGLSTIIVTNYV